MDIFKNYHRKLKVDYNLQRYRAKIIKECKLCSGGGSLIKSRKIDFSKSLLEIDKQLNKNFQPCRCLVKYKKIERLILSGIREEFWRVKKWDFGDTNKDSWKHINHYVKNLKDAVDKGIGFILYGPNGTQKTTAGIYVLINALEQNYNVHYIFMLDLITTIRELVVSKDENVKKANKCFLQEVFDCDIIFMDELGKVKNYETSDFTMLQFEAFLRKRALEKKSMIMATNKKDEVLLRSYGESVFDLMRGYNKKLEFKSPYKGASYRKKLSEDVDKFFKE